MFYLRAPSTKDSGPPVITPPTPHLFLRTGFLPQLAPASSRRTIDSSGRVVWHAAMGELFSD